MQFRTRLYNANELRCVLNDLPLAEVCALRVPVPLVLFEIISSSRHDHHGLTSLQTLKTGFCELSHGTNT